MFKKFISVFSSSILALLSIISPTHAVNPQNISLDKKIGQMMCLDFRFWNEKNLNQTEEIGIVTSDKTTVQTPVRQINDDIRNIVAKYHIGSVILFAQNFESKEQAKQLIDDLQKTAKESGNPPLIIAVDQEGGRVERFSFGREKLKNNAEIKTAEEAFKKGQIIGKELSELGINCNFAPVVDVNSNPKNPVINVRSFGDSADVVSKFGTSFMEGLHSSGIISTAKHFPGHGDTNVDSHLGLPKVDKALKELECMELKPFKAMIDAGVDMIMTAHIELPQVEIETITSKKGGSKIHLPATLSKTILTNLLRGKMGFKGIIVTDAMDMKAISENFGEADAIKMAIQAGADMICMPVTLRSKSDIQKLDKIFEILKISINSGEITEYQINQTVERILKLKEKNISLK